MRRVHESCAGNHGPASAKGVVHHQTGSSTTDERAQNTQFLNPTQKKRKELTPEKPFHPGRIQDECESRQRDPRQCCPAYRYENKGERGRVQEPLIRCSAAQATTTIATRATPHRPTGRNRCPARPARANSSSLTADSLSWSPSAAMCERKQTRVTATAVIASFRK